MCVHSLPADVHMAPVGGANAATSSGRDFGLFLDLRAVISMGFLCV